MAVAVHVMRDADDKQAVQPIIGLQLCDACPTPRRQALICPKGHFTDERKYGCKYAQNITIGS